MEYDPRTALVIVDVQNDFADPDGGLYVAGGGETIAGINRELERARAAGALVVYTQDWHPPSTPHFARDGGMWPVHCVRDTWGADFHRDLEVVGEVVRKGVAGEDGYSGFTMRDAATGATVSTTLEPMLRAHDVERVIVVGLAADVCVKDTALDALARGFVTVVLRELTRGVDLEPGDTERAFAALTQAGATVE